MKNYHRNLLYILWLLRDYVSKTIPSFEFIFTASMNKFLVLDTALKGDIPPPTVVGCLLRTLSPSKNMLIIKSLYHAVQMAQSSCHNTGMKELVRTAQDVESVWKSAFRPPKLMSKSQQRSLRYITLLDAEPISSANGFWPGSLQRSTYHIKNGSEDVQGRL
jgi:hypothetical protein